jgi:hypothetical protein
MKPAFPEMATPAPALACSLDRRLGYVRHMRGDQDVISVGLRQIASEQTVRADEVNKARFTQANSMLQIATDAVDRHADGEYAQQLAGIIEHRRAHEAGGYAFAWGIGGEVGEGHSAALQSGGRPEDLAQTGFRPSAAFCEIPGKVGPFGQRVDQVALGVEKQDAVIALLLHLGAIAWMEAFVMHVVVEAVGVRNVGGLGDVQQIPLTDGIGISGDIGLLQLRAGIGHFRPGRPGAGKLLDRVDGGRAAGRGDHVALD